VTVIFVIASSPRLSGSRMGPYSATRAGLVLIARAAATRSAAVAYRLSVAAAEA
jgi:hypothetical protein